MTLATDKSKVSSYMDGEKIRRAKVLAAMEGLSLSAYIELLVDKEIEKAEVRGVRFDLISEQS